jgi:hypothetical protein
LSVPHYTQKQKNSDAHYARVADYARDNIMVDYAKSIGGVDHDYKTDWMRHDGIGSVGGGGLPLSSGGPRPRGPSLSKAHIRPFVEWVEGASLIKTTVYKPGASDKRGKRGKIKGFSYASRLRLLEVIGAIRRDAELPMFATVTYPDKFPTCEQAKKDLAAFVRRMKRQFSECAMIWKMEPQERGAPHFHMLIWGVSLHELMSFVPVAWFDIAGQGDHNHLLFHLGLLKNQHCVQAVRTFRGVWNYAAKYIGKTFEVAGWSEQWTGRFWGIINSENIPFGKICNQEVDLVQAYDLMRAQRHFMGRKGKKKNKFASRGSLKTFCDADQWVKNFVAGEVKEKNSSKIKPAKVLKGSINKRQ